VSARQAAQLDSATGYLALRPGGAGAAVRTPAGLLWVEGPDAPGFLHGLLSNDVAGLPAGGACRALILDAKGHLQADMRVHRDGPEAFTLLLAPGLAGEVAGLLERYHFSEDLEVLGPEPAETLVVAGPLEAAREAAHLAVPGPVPGTLELVADDPAALVGHLGLAEAPPEALEMARIAAGVPRVGIDTGPATLVQEAGLEEVAVSFSKGCYLGQETVARAQYRGRVNRRLRGLELPWPAPAAPAAVRREGRELGRLTSVASTPDLGAIGLAVLRREASPGEPVEVEGAAGPARVVELPFPGR
jgi:folate-binding protein YgfZ